MKSAYNVLQNRNGQLEDELQITKRQLLDWQAKLGSKAKEFEALRESMEKNMKEMENMRNRLDDESQMRQRLEREIEDCDKYKEMYTKVNAEHELLKSKHQQLVFYNTNY